MVFLGEPGQIEHLCLSGLVCKKKGLITFRSGGGAQRVIKNREHLCLLFKEILECLCCNLHLLVQLSVSYVGNHGGKDV